MLLLSTRQAYAEVDSFIELLNEYDRNKLPKKLIEFFKTHKDFDYKKTIDPNLDIEKQNLKRETLAIIAFLNLKYFCDSEEEKQRLIRIYKENETKQVKDFYKKLNRMDDTKNTNSESIDMQLKPYENKSLFANIIEKILNIFKKK